MWVLLVLIGAATPNQDSIVGKMEIKFQNQDQCVEVLDSMKNSGRAEYYKFVRQCEKIQGR